jgi:hypothetical protein
MILGDGTPKKAFFTALVVGTVLTAINHGDVILSGSAPPPWKVILTCRHEQLPGSAEWSQDR